MLGDEHGPARPSFDIHTGGVDLVFPHHEDEIAQSEAATGLPFVRTWMHCAHLRMGGEKMAKSVGNIARVADLIASGVAPRALRYALISVHYRASLNYSDESLDGGRGRGGAHRCRARGARRVPRGPPRRSRAAGGPGRARAGFEAGLDDDLNVSEALGGLVRRDPGPQPAHRRAHPVDGRRGSGDRPDPRAGRGPGRGGAGGLRPRPRSARRCWRPGSRRARRGTGPSRTGSAMHCLRAASRSRTRATASAGAWWSRPVADRKGPRDGDRPPGRVGPAAATGDRRAAVGGDRAGPRIAARGRPTGPGTSPGPKARATKDEA